MINDDIQNLEKLMFLDEALLQQRYAIYQRLLTGERIVWSERLRQWILPHYADVKAAINDQRLSSEPAPANYRKNRAPDPLPLPPDHPLFRQAGKIMMSRDDPDHARIRSLVHKAFSARAIAQQRTLIQELTGATLQLMEQQARPDFIRDVAIPLPITIIAAMIGLPIEDREQLKRWSDAGADFLTQVADPTTAFMRMAQTAVEFNAYLRPHLEERRLHPREDLLSALLLAEMQGDRLTEDELVANVFLLLAAGNETTTNLLGNSIWTLLSHPEQTALLRQQPALIDSAVEEILRYQSPSQATGRRVTHPMKVAGQSLEPNMTIMLLLGAANRDAAQFADPDTFTITRTGNKHLAFGLGPHYCLGAPLARLEAHVILPLILDRYPHLRLMDEDEPPHWLKNPTFLGLSSLPLALS